MFPPVLVTGATGFVASELVQQLLAKGYTVHATTRSLSDKSKLVNLLAFPGASERLHLFEVNLQEASSYAPALVGVKIVFHVAAPVIQHSENPWDEVVNPTVQATTSAFRAAVAMGSVETFIYTSSVVATVLHRRAVPGRTYDENDWSTEATLAEDSYHLAKRLAEEALHFESKKHKNIRLVSLILGLVIGPYFPLASGPHTPNTLAASLRDILPVVSSGPEGPIGPVVIPFVDVRDVALAHILAAETPTANGRYWVFGEAASLEKFASIVRRNFPTLPVAGKVIAPPHNINFTNSKIKAEFGITFRPLEESINTTVSHFVQDGIVKPVAK